MTNKTVSAEILNQLGGRRFIAMTGAKNLGTNGNDLVFHLGRNAEKVKYFRVTLTAADDYTLEAMNSKGEVTKTMTGVYCDNLQTVFTQMTGLYTRL